MKKELHQLRQTYPNSVLTRLKSPRVLRRSFLNLKILKKNNIRKTKLLLFNNTISAEVLSVLQVRVLVPASLQMIFYSIQVILQLLLSVLHDLYLFFQLHFGILTLLQLVLDHVLVLKTQKKKKICLLQYSRSHPK